MGGKDLIARGRARLIFGVEDLFLQYCQIAQIISKDKGIAAVWSIQVRDSEATQLGKRTVLLFSPTFPVTVERTLVIAC